LLTKRPDAASHRPERKSEGWQALGGPAFAGYGEVSP